MDSLIIYFLPTIVALGTITSFEDLSEGKIRNKYLIAAMIVALVIHLILISFQIITWKYLALSASYCISTFIIGFLLWQFGWWNAGDAKLFAVFAFLTPLTAYKHITTQAPFLELGFNALIPVTVYLVFALFLKTKNKQKIDALKKTLSPRRIIYAIITIFSISWLNMYIFRYSGIKPNIILNFLLIVIILKILERIFHKQTITILTVASVLRVFLNTDYFTTKAFLLSFILMILAYIILMGFIRQLSEYYLEHININYLRPGMIAAEGILKTGFKAPLGKHPPNQYILTKTIPLSESDVKKIKTWHRQGRLHFNLLKVNQTIFFAPHLFFGTLSTIICQGSIMLFLKSMI